jgi:lycopene cyclase domain-containing protein
MELLYIGYLSLVFIGTILLMRISTIKFTNIQKKATIFSLILTTIAFSAWDVWAITQNHWSFGLEHTLGITILNQPIEEILFFLIIPFFGLTLFLFFQKREGKK